MPVPEIADSLYIEQPPDGLPLFHYTSMKGLLGILESKTLYATDVHFFSDASEIKRTAMLLRDAVRRVRPSDESTKRLHHQLIDWLAHRLTELGHAIFAVSFTANGNLLSQWRSYCDPGKGVSIGFMSERLREAAAAQSYRI